MKIDDVVGSFDKVVTALSKCDINIQYTYSFYESDIGIFIFSVEKDKFSEAVQSLLDAKLEVISASHFYK